jgi:NTE family protein
MSETAPPKIGLALSGGGSRAIAFHLGCLRALHRLGLLDRVAILSTVSGGSVIGAYFHAHFHGGGGDFAPFEAKSAPSWRRDSRRRCAGSCSA